MKPILRRLSLPLVAAAAFLVVSIPPTGVEGAQNLSIALVMDNSGSMARTDPASLRFVAASQVVDLLEEGDEISVITFADDSAPLVPLTIVSDEASREAIKAKLAPVAPEGNTNMRAGLEGALAELGKASNSIRIAIFLTDGELHPPGWPDLSAQDQEAERSAVVALADSFGTREWDLFPVSLASAVEPDFLRRLADGGGGLYQQAPEASELTLAFQRIFSGAKLDVFEVLFADCLAPGQQSSVAFPVHQFVSSLSLFVTYYSDIEPAVTLAGPDGESIAPTGGGTRYDAFDIDKPRRGSWTVTVTGSAEGESCVSVSSTPRAVVEVEWLEPPPSLSLPEGGPLYVAVRLTALDPQTDAEDPVEGATVSVTATGPAGEPSVAELAYVGSGVYRGTVVAEALEGTYQVALVAETEEGVVAQRSLEASVSFGPATDPAPSPGPTSIAGAGPARREGGGGPALLLILLPPVILVGLAASFGAYCRLGRPVLTGWLMSVQADHAWNLESRHRRTWWRRALTIGGADDDIDLGLERRWARIIPGRRQGCALQAGARGDVVVDGKLLRKGQRRTLRHGSEIILGGVALEYRRYVGGPRFRV